MRVVAAVLKSTVLNRREDGKHLAVVRRSKTSNRVPAGNGRETYVTAGAGLVIAI